MSLEKLSLWFKRVHLIRLALALLAVNCLVFAFLVLPMQSRISIQQSDYSSARTETASRQKQLQELDSRVVALKKAQKDLDEIYTKWLVPRKKGATDIRLELESLTRSLQVRRQDVSLNYAALEDYKLQYFTISVPVEGTYRNIRLFINGLERSKHFLILETVNLSSEKKADVLNLDFRLSTYLVDDEIEP